jgi:hypothetical protein
LVRARIHGGIVSGGMKRAVAVATLAAALALPMGAFARGDRSSLVTEVHVTVTDSSLIIHADQPNPGPATIFVVNRGHKPHVLTISGPGLRSARTQRVAPESRMTFDLKLLAGAYKVTDPVLGKTTVRWLVVRPSNLVPGTPVTPPKTSPTTATVPGGMDCDL